MMAATDSDFRARYQQATRMFRVAAPSPLARLGMVLIGIALLGLLIILGVFSLLVGGVVIAIGAIVFTVQMLIAKFRGGSLTGQSKDQRENVRVIRRDIE